ncbi:MAG: PA2779 family protein [Kiloniellales bacterium]
MDIIRTKTVSRYRSVMALTMAAAILLASFPTNMALAAMVSTDQVIEVAASAEARARVTDFMAREDVRRDLQSLGIDPEEAARRAAALSDREIQQIAGHLEELPAGQDVVGALVGALLVIFLVLLVTDLLGMTDVFPFVKSQK